MRFKMDKIVRKSIIETLRGCIKHGDFVLRSGKKSRYYMDLRTLVSKPREMNTISSLIWDKLPKDGYHKTYPASPHKYWAVGLPYAGIPHACHLSSQHLVPMVLLRNEAKKHGTANMIEGDFKQGDHLVIIDDVLTTGSSVMDALPFLNDFVIDKVVVIVDREQGGKEKLEGMGLKVESIFKISEIMDISRDYLNH